MLLGWLGEEVAGGRKSETVVDWQTDKCDSTRATGRRRVGSVNRIMCTQVAILSLAVWTYWLSNLVGISIELIEMNEEWRCCALRLSEAFGKPRLWLFVAVG